MKAKPHNINYFNSIKIQSLRRYALWLIGSPGYSYSIFEGMNKSMLKGEDAAEEMHDWESAYPQEFTWFTKHLEKHPEAIEVQEKLFNIHN